MLVLHADVALERTMLCKIIIEKRDVSQIEEWSNVDMIRAIMSFYFLPLNNYVPFINKEIPLCETSSTFTAYLLWIIAVLVHETTWF